jgi:colanic acid/amylovoran biosynthesis glycosyltransferase
MNNPSKIHVLMRLHAFPNLSETFILNQIRYLLKKDVELHILANDIIWGRMNKLCLAPNIHFHLTSKLPLKKKLRAYGRTLLSIFNWLRLNTISFLRKRSLIVTKTPNNFVFDIYHCQYATYIKEAVDLKASRELSYKHLVSSGRGYDVTSELIARPEDFLPYLASLALYLPVSQSLAKPLVDLGFPEDKIAILHSGIDLTDLRKNIKKDNENTAHKKLVSVGRLVEKKGVSDSISALKLLIDEGYQLTYDIFGDGPLYKELELLIQNCGLVDNVKLHGATPHEVVVESIRNADLFLLHSKTGKDGNAEGIPNVLKEAMLLGVLVATTKHSGIEELFENDYFDYLAAEGDIPDITEKLKSLLRMNEVQKNQLLKINKKRIEKNFDIVHLTDELYNHYRSLIT